MNTYVQITINKLSTNLAKDITNLIPTQPVPGLFYGIPKIHKLPKLVRDTLCTTNSDNTDIDNLSINDIYNAAKDLSILPPLRPIISRASAHSQNEYPAM